MGSCEERWDQVRREGIREEGWVEIRMGSCEEGWIRRGETG
jgi:hypothetical protein